jgi:hypothetical protein
LHGNNPGPAAGEARKSSPAKISALLKAATWYLPGPAARRGEDQAEQGRQARRQRTGIAAMRFAFRLTST